MQESIGMTVTEGLYAAVQGFDAARALVVVFDQLHCKQKGK